MDIKICNKQVFQNPQEMAENWEIVILSTQ